MYVVRSAFYYPLAFFCSQAESRTRDSSLIYHEPSTMNQLSSCSICNLHFAITNLQLIFSFHKWNGETSYIY